MKKPVTLILIATILFILWALRGPISDAMIWFGDLSAITDQMDRLGQWGPVVLFTLFLLQVFLAFIPGQALMVASGHLYGFWGGFLLSWTSLVIGGELAYFLARRYGYPFARRWISPDVLSRWDKAAEGQGVGFFTLSLVMPLVPNDAMCYVAGLGTISHRRFLLANMLGRGMASLLASAAGAFGSNIPWQGWAVSIGILVLIGLAWQVINSRKSNLYKSMKGDCHAHAG